MELTVFERAVLLNVLPKEGNFKTLRTVKKLRENLSLSDEEIDKWQPSVEDGNVWWKVQDDEGNPIPQQAEVEITEHGKEVVREILQKLDKDKKLKMEHYSLYEKFVGDD